MFQTIAKVVLISLFIPTAANADAFCIFRQGSDQPFTGDNEYIYAPLDVPGYSVTGGGCGVGDHGNPASPTNLAIHASLPQIRAGMVVGWVCSAYVIKEGTSGTRPVVTPSVILCPIRK